MSHAEAMKNDLPLGLFTDDPNAHHNKELDSIGKQLDDIEGLILDLEKQFSLSTCTWSIKYYEKEFGVKSPAGATTEERRANVLVKSQGGRGTNPNVIKSILKVYGLGQTDLIEDFADYIVTVSLIEKRGVPDNMEDAKKTIRNLIHGHLEIGYKFIYVPWKEIMDAKITWGDLRGYTWKKVGQSYPEPPKLTWKEVDVMTWDEFESLTWNEFDSKLTFK